MAKDDLQLFGGDWTERKLDALDQYLRAYAKVLSKQAFRRVYIDAFAGTGYRELRSRPIADHGSMFPPDEDPAGTEPQRFLDGSAPIALRVTPPFHQYMFIELEPRRAAELEALKRRFPNLAGSIEIRCGEANQSICELCRNWDSRRSRGVLFLDPFGMQVEWPTIQAVAKTGAIDVWILFPFAVNRLFTSRPEDIPPSWHARLTLMFGSEDWLGRFYPPQVIPSMFGESETVVEKKLTLEGLGAYYKERLKAVFPVVAKNPCMLRNTRNHPLFQLFFAAASPGRGGEIALQIAEYILTRI